MGYINQKKYYTNDGVNPTNANWGLSIVFL